MRRTRSFRSTLSQNVVNESGRLLESPGKLRPVLAGMYPGSLANQGGFALGIGGGVGATNAGAAFTPSARNATTLTVADTVNWLKGSHSIGLGGEFGQCDVARHAGLGGRAVHRVGTQNGDPALGMFTGELRGQRSGDRNNAAALYAVLTGRVTSIGAERSTGCWHGPSLPGDSRAEGRLPRQFDFFIQDNWRAKPNLSINASVCVPLQMPFSAQNASYSAATLDSLWGISGYVPGCG